MHRQYDLIVLSNRDERYDRPTLLAHAWADQPIFAGRDKQQHGTWCAATHAAAALVTNYRDPSQSIPPQARSRGELPVRFLTQSLRGIGVADFLDTLTEQRTHYAGYSVLVADSKHLGYYSNQRTQPSILSPGVYGLSNALLNTPWFKVQQGMDALKSLLQAPQLDLNACWAMMENTSLAPDDVLPQTGIAYDKEKAYSAPFIKTPNYGTRTTTLLLRNTQKMTFIEKNHISNPPQIIHQDLIHNPA